MKRTVKWTCLACNMQEFDSTNEFREHLQATHHIDTSKTKATMSETMHMDGKGFYSSAYDVMVGDLKFILTEHVDKKG